MQTDFEPIYKALETRLKAATTAKRVSRRLLHWSAVPQGDHPAIFIMQKGESTEQEKGIPTKWRLRVDLYVYVHVGNSTTAIPSSILNSVLAQIRAALLPNEISRVPEGFAGLVSHLWIDGEIELFDGVMGAQAAAIVPIQALTV